MRVKGLDFLRAIAILSVLLFHFYPEFLPGGFLGVDLFFVISGFIITFILYTEYKKNGEIDIKNFYIKRIKRIVPALLFMVITFMVFLFFYDRNLFYSQFNDAIYGCLFLTNWFNIYNSITYFDLNTYPFKHLWSIAIEQQFYIFFPFILIIVLKFKRLISIIMLSILAFCSFLLMYLLFDPSNIELIYYNFFTRFYAFLIGAIFAILYYHLEKKVLTKRSILRTSFSVVIIIFYGLCFFKINETNPLLYEGGLLLFYIITGILILCLALPGNLVINLLDNKIIRKISNRSYSLYLWHYPVLVVFLSPQYISKQSLITTFILMIIILLITEFSYQVIEKNLRYNKWLSLKLPKVTLISVITITTLFIFITLSGIANFQTYQAEETNNSNTTNPMEEVDNYDTQTYISSAYTIFGNIDTQIDHVHEKSTKSVEIQDDMYSRPVIVFGDSISLNYQSLIYSHFDDVTYVAEVGMQMYEIIDIVDQYSECNTEDYIVILNIGTNGRVYLDELEYFINTFDQADIYLINTAYDSYWSEEVNENMQTMDEKYENTYLVNWNDISEGHPEYFGSDGIHLTKQGSNAMVSEIERVIMSSYE